MKTLAKTLSVLDLFTDVHDEWRVTDISHKLALPVATTHRIVRSLTDPTDTCSALIVRVTASTNARSTWVLAPYTRSTSEQRCSPFSATSSRRRPRR